MNAQDFRDEEPVWVKYAEYVGQGSDKFYETTIHFGDDGVYYLQKRWGRNPDTGVGQIKVEPYASLQNAQAAAHGIFNEKIRKGYRIIERPYTASPLGVRLVTDDDYR